jgi:hypothetical protein
LQFAGRKLFCFAIMQIYATLVTDTAVRNLEESRNSYNRLDTFVRIQNNEQQV